MAMNRKIGAKAERKGDMIPAVPSALKTAKENQKIMDMPIAMPIP